MKNVLLLLPFDGPRLRIALIIGGLMCAGNMASAALTLISDPKVLAIPIKESNEDWVNLSKQTIIAYGPSPEVSNNRDYIYLRKTVYDKLVAAQSKLPKGLHFCVYEGYRSLALQKQLFEQQFANEKTRNPDWSEAQVFLETTKLVSPIMNLDRSLNIPPHSTGGAIDVYLVDDKGNAVDMGIHPKDWMQDIGGKLSLTASKQISQRAKAHRHSMNQVLAAVGFVNYPTEYWHWSYGDRYWAYVKHQTYAIYGSYKH